MSQPSEHPLRRLVALLPRPLRAYLLPAIQRRFQWDGDPSGPGYPRTGATKWLRCILEIIFILVVLQYVLNIPLEIITIVTNGVPLTWDSILQALNQGLVGKLIARSPGTALRVIGAQALIALLTLLAFLDSRYEKRLADEHLKPTQPPPSQNEFVLQPIQSLDPNRYVPRYYPEVLYVPRHDAKTGADADALARTALTQVAQRDPATIPDPYASVGICVYGKPMQGKTRLAWDAMRAALPGWTFVRWRASPVYRFDLAAQQGKRLALWLDDLQDLARNPFEATPLKTIVGDCAALCIPLVIVATCRDGIEEEQTRGALPDLLHQLTEIRPRNLSDEESDELAESLLQHQKPVSESDGTPGSLVLDVARMAARYQQFLGGDARRLLKAMKLLRSVGINDFPPERLQAVAHNLFNLPENPGAYTAAAELLEREGFVQQEQDASFAATGLRALAPVADIYLERTIGDYPNGGHALYEDWLALRLTLEHVRDGDALISLGNAFYELSVGINPAQPSDLRANRQQCIACYRAALLIYPREISPINWAATQNNLGVVLRARAQLAEGEEQRHLLRAAQEACISALEVRTRATTPADWAETQNNLGSVLGARAQLAAGVEQRRLLQGAEEAFRQALMVQTSATTPTDSAETQNNLGNVLANQAELAVGEEQLNLLQGAKEAFVQALLIYSPTINPRSWATIQNNLGTVLRDQAHLTTKHAEKRGLLQDAEAAYRQALEVRTRATTPIDWAATQNNLGVVLRARAQLAEGEEQCRLLSAAQEACRQALEVYTRTTTPIDWAATMFNVALLYLNLVEIDVSQDARCSDLRAADGCLDQALPVLHFAYPGLARDAEEMRNQIAKVLRDLGCQRE